MPLILPVFLIILLTSSIISDRSILHAISGRHSGVALCAIAKDFQQCLSEVPSALPYRHSSWPSTPLARSTPESTFPSPALAKEDTSVEGQGSVEKQGSVEEQSVQKHLVVPMFPASGDPQLAMPDMCRSRKVIH